MIHVTESQDAEATHFNSQKTISECSSASTVPNTNTNTNTSTNINTKSTSNSSFENENSGLVPPTISTQNDSNPSTNIEGKVSTHVETAIKNTQSTVNRIISGKSKTEMDNCKTNCNIMAKSQINQKLKHHMVSKSDANATINRHNKIEHFGHKKVIQNHIKQPDRTTVENKIDNVQRIS